MQDCTKYTDGSGTRLSCEAGNLIIQTEKDQSFTQGTLFGFFLMGALIGLFILYRWADKKGKR